MAKEIKKKLKKLRVKEQPAKIDMPVDDFLKLALNTPIKNSKVNKK